MPRRTRLQRWKHACGRVRRTPPAAQHAQRGRRAPPPPPPTYPPFVAAQGSRRGRPHWPPRRADATPRPFISLLALPSRTPPFAYAPLLLRRERPRGCRCSPPPPSAPWHVGPGPGARAGRAPRAARAAQGGTARNTAAHGCFRPLPPHTVSPPLQTAARATGRALEAGGRHLQPATVTQL
ncbi:MAG: hypothetical protein J3K34DRAFT_256010 [Monoraphidium minutum]|nr:MAG: hypothetical protein J3K34DRAFT_256010 [Monoraphidium minutum]